VDPKLIEATRARYRPSRIATLFVGESAPRSGAFFYCGNTALAREMERVMKTAGVTASGDFLEQFKARGWYLDDLVLTPVNHLGRAERNRRCRAAEQSLADRIARYQPRAIVALLLGIKAIVEAAATAPRYAVPFPGNGQQARFRRELALILPQLPTANTVACGRAECG
jgi:hypothetical protein